MVSQGKLHGKGRGLVGTAEGNKRAGASIDGRLRYSYREAV
jgi:hypothetical protein